MKKVSSTIKKRIRELCQQHAWNMGVSHYVIDIHYMEKDKSHDGFDVQAQMTVDRRYLHGTLKIYPRVIKVALKEPETLDDVISHEIAHLLTDHLHFLATATYKDEGEMRDAWETLTEMIGRMSHRIRKLETKGR